MNIERKKRYLVLHRDDGNFRKLCAVLRIAPKTGYEWLHRYDSGGFEDLLNDKPRGRPRQEVSTSVETAVLNLRSLYGWNEKKIHKELANHHIETSFHAVRQTLTKANVLGVAPQRRKRTFRRFERPLPNHLWQADFSLLDDGTWLFALIDDYSRYLIDAEEFEDETTENALFVCRRAVQRHGSPFQLMTDHGVQFWNNNQKRSNSFGQTLEVWRVEHILAGVKRPQTNGKMERWFGTFKKEVSRFKTLQDYLYYYNFCRPHAGINYAKPYERYFAFKL